MSKEETKDLLNFLMPFSEDIRETALWLREFVWDLYPRCNELIYDNYNALAFGWSPSDRTSDTFCSVGVMSKYVHFGFYWGSKIADHKKILLGKGTQYRYIIVKNKNDFPKTYMKKLLKEAHAYSLTRLKDDRPVMQGATITRSISPIKKRPGIATPKKNK